GKGSSREHSPSAELAAGIQLVVAESFERIYRQNADNVGLFTSTDFGLLERIACGEAITVDELVAGREPLAAAILRCGGLLKYGRHCELRAASDSQVARPRTLVEKIIERHALLPSGLDGPLRPGTGAFVSADLRFIH